MIEKTHQYDELLAIIAILKLVDDSLPADYFRILAIFVLDPYLLTPHLTPEDKKEWRRLVGKEAEKVFDIDDLPDLQEDEFSATAWGNAVRYLRGNCILIDDTCNGTWAPGIGLDKFNTTGWADDRARFVINATNSESIPLYLFSNLN